MVGPPRYTGAMSDSPHPEITVLLADESQTIALGQQLATQVTAPAVLYLHGELGAGKTTFSRGFLQGRGHTGSVKSPTYTLVESYESLAEAPVFHLDLYRLGESGELEYLGIEDYLTADGILLIEWPERAEGRLPEATLDITLVTEGSGRVAHLRSPDPALLHRFKV